MLGRDRIASRVLNLVPQDLRAKVGERAYEAFVAARRKLLGARVGEVLISEGRRMEYLEIDRGKDETILFLHGFADSKDTFYDAAQFLVGEFNIICPDLPGFGRSFKHRHEKYSIENYGQWICEFIEAINLDGFHIAGNSLGGAAALQTTLMIPQKIKTMTLVDPAGIYLPEPYCLHHELFDGHVIFDVKSPEEFEYFLNRVFTKVPFIPHPIKDFVYKEFSRHGLWHRKILADLIKGLVSDEDPRIFDMAMNDRLADLKVPTFLIWGDDDTFFPKETAYFMQHEIENCEVQFMSDVGHCPQIESPRKFARIFRKFLHKQCLGFNRREKQKYFQVHDEVSKGIPSKDEVPKRSKTAAKGTGKPRRQKKPAARKPNDQKDLGGQTLRDAPT